MDLKTASIQLVTAFLGSMGFSLLFGMRRRHLVWGGLGGVLTWGCYLLVSALLHEGFLPCLLAAGVAVFYSEVLAHLRKTPATIFVVPAIIPLVPGSSLYYAMAAAVRGDLSEARHFGSITLQSALAIAAGISFVIALRQLQTTRSTDHKL